MWLTSIIYSLLETIIEMVMEAIVFLSSKLLSTTVSMFSSDISIFDQFIGIIFPEGTNIPGIIKGISYGVLILCMLISTIKSIASPITGDDTPNPAQVVVRTFASVVIIFVLFGFNFGNSFEYEGLLNTLGRWFGGILNLLMQDSSINHFDFNLSMTNPLYFLVDLVILVSILISVFGACITYVERILSFAVYVILGPVAVAMYSNKETANTTREWIIGIFTQFMAIFVSLLMWKFFLVKLANAFGTDDFMSGTSIFNFAVCLAILGIMKNSEKILNSVGIRTMAQGDAARSIGAGVAKMMMGARLAMSAKRAYNKSHINTPAKQQELYDEQGNLNVPSSPSVLGTGTTAGYVTTWDPRGYRKSHHEQGEARQRLVELSEETNATASDINTAYGLNNHTSVEATGNGKRELKAVSYDSERFVRDDNNNIVYNADGSVKYEKVTGWMGNFEYRNNGVRTELEDAVIVKNGINNPIKAGTSAGIGTNGNERYFAESHPIITNEGHYIYKTTEKQPSIAPTPQPEPVRDRKEVSRTLHEGNKEFEVD